MDMSNSEIFKKNDVVIDAVNYNGKYIESSVFKKKIVSTLLCILAAVCVGILIVAF